MPTKPQRPNLAVAALAATAALLAALPSPHALSAQVESHHDLVFPDLPEFEIPTPRRVELDNGIVVLLLEDHELPLVEATALIETGKRLEPADKAGLASITGEVIRTGGTERLSPDELDDFLEGKAASIESSIERSHGRVTLSSLAADFPEVLRVFADVLRRPAFAPERIDVALTRARAEIARQNDHPQSILFRELRSLVYGPASPYARTETYATLAAIERSDLVAWHERYYQPDRVILGLVGDLDPDRAIALVREAFGDWENDADEGSRAVEPAEPWYREEPNPGVFVAEKADVNQSNIALAHLGIRRDDPDFYAVEVMNELFGGSMTSRLFSEVRTRRGLAYAVAGRVGAGWDFPGVTYAFTTTKVATTGEAIRALLDEVRALRDGRPPSEDEVARAKRSLLTSFVFRVDSAEEVLREQLTYEYYGYPLDRLAAYRDRIEAVTVDQVRAAAVAHLRPDRFSILVVGPAEGRDVDLSTFGPVQQIDLTIPPPPAP